MLNTIILHYKLTRLIGEGGMASVYEAEHEMLGTKVAIKILNSILSANTQIRERFKNEAKVMASLNHPNITRVIDFDENPQQLSIVMEYLEGEDLSQKIKKNGPLKDQQLNTIFSQTLSAFQYAHEKGIVHRDIKPSNIFILPDGQVKILDFGIAKLFGQSNEMTQTGTQMGTPTYMSPEQVKADKTIDNRSDIYSLGVTLYYAVNGKSPYNSTTESQFDIFNKIVYEPLPDVTGNSKYNGIIKKACAKNREERYQNCNAWLAEMNNPTAANSSASFIEDKTIFENKISDGATQIQEQFKNTSSITTQKSSSESTPDVQRLKKKIGLLEQETENKANEKRQLTNKTPQEKKPDTGLIIGFIASVIFLVIIIITTSGSRKEEMEADGLSQDSIKRQFKLFELNNLLIKAENFKNLGIYDSAEILYKKAINIDSITNCEIYGNIGKLWLKAKEYDKAILAFNNKLNCFKILSGQDYYDLGRAYFYGPKDMLNADTCFAELTYSYPNYPLGYFWRGKVHLQTDIKNEKWLAKPYFEKALELIIPEDKVTFKSNIIEACEYLGWFYVKKNDILKAKEYYQMIIELDPNNKKVEYFLLENGDVI